LPDPETILKRMAAAETHAMALSDLTAQGPSLVEPITALYWREELLRPQAGEALLSLANNNPDAAKPAVPVFIDLIKSSNGFLQEQAVQVLGELGSAARSAIGPLTEALSNNSIRRSAASSLDSIAEALQDNAQHMTLGELASAARDLQRGREAILRNLPQEEAASYEARVRRPTEYLLLRLQLENASMPRTLLSKAEGHLGLFAVAGCILALYVAVGLLYWLYPVALVSTGRSATPLRRVLCLHWLAGQERTQDAWIERHLTKARESLLQRAGHEDQHIRIAVPIKVDGDVPARIGVETLQKIFSALRVRLLIHGEGGVGKTNLAYQIARWAVNPDPNSRLCPRHVMLPVFLRAGFSMPEVAGRSPNTPGYQLFLNAIAHELAVLADLPLPPSDDWVERLLVGGRILLITDDLAEADAAMQSVLGITGGGCHANALVVTSRDEHALRGTQSAMLEPVRLEGESVDAFVSGYLESRNKRQLFPGTSLSEACGQLRGIAAKRSVTVLMAKLYADLMVSRRESVRGESGGSGETLVSSVPELMLQYLSYLNRGSDLLGLPRDHEIHPAAKRVAWACLSRDLVPSSLDRREAIEALGDGAMAARWIEHMEKRLRLLKVDGASRDRVRFSLDPLAEYLAGLWLASDYRSDRALWEAFLQKADRRRIEAPGIISFLAAVLDCCETERQRQGVPESVIRRLRGLLGN